MPAYARAHVIKNHLFTLDGVDYSNQLNTVLFVPTSETVTYKIAVPDGSVTDNDSPTWTVQLIGIQDFGAGSLGAALAALDGLEGEIVYQPINDEGQDRTEAVMRGAPVPIGGTAGTVRTFDQTFGIVGKPETTQSPVVP